MAKSKRRRTQRSKALRVLYAIVAFIALGYFPTRWLGDFRVSMVAAALAVIPFGAKSPRVARGLLRGALLGLLAGVAIVIGLARYQMQRDSVVTDDVAALCVAGTVVACGLIAALFAHLAKKRQEIADREW